MTLTNFIINDVQPIAHDATVGEIQTIFSQTTYSHIPIAKENTYQGCLAENDAHCYDSDTIINEYAHAIEPFFVRYETHWLDVIEAFALHNTNLMPVLDAEGIYLGYYELADVMSFFNSTTFLSEPGSVVVVERGATDYSFSEISQIVESNDGKILGLFIAQIENDVAQINVKVGANGFNNILSAFRRYGYTIISSHQEDTFLKDLKERSRYLEKYLNI